MSRLINCVLVYGVGVAVGLLGVFFIIILPPGGASPGAALAFERSRPCIWRRIVAWSGTPGVGVTPGFVFVKAFFESLLGGSDSFALEFVALFDGAPEGASTVVGVGNVGDSDVSAFEFAFARALTASVVFVLDTLEHENINAVAKIKLDNNEILIIKTSNKNAI